MATNKIKNAVIFLIAFSENTFKFKPIANQAADHDHGQEKPISLRFLHGLQTPLFHELPDEAGYRIDQDKQAAKSGDMFATAP